MADFDSREDAKPRRVQLKRTKGWRMPVNTVKVDRTTKWGNPFIVGKARGATCKWAVDAFKRCLAPDGEHWRLGFNPARVAEELGGKNLACWCALDMPCHADVLLELAQSTTLDQTK